MTYSGAAPAQGHGSDDIASDPALCVTNSKGEVRPNVGKMIIYDH